MNRDRGGVLKRVRGGIWALLLAGCAAGQQSTAGPRAQEEARTAIIAASGEFSARYMRGDVEGMMDIYTPDGVILPPGRPAIRGRAALTEYWRLPEGMRVLEHRATPDSIVVMGTVAYDWGTYFIRTRNGDAEARETHGKYVIVWREAEPRKWRMHIDMWNGSPPPSR